MSIAANLVTAVTRTDAWQNAMTGLGTLRDKLTYQKQTMAAPLNDAELEAMYTDDDIAAKIVSQLPSDALREGFRVKIGPDEIEDASSVSTDICDALVKLDAVPTLRAAWIWARLYGWGAVFVGADDGQDPSMPLDLERVRSIKFLTALRRTQVNAETYYDDIEQPKYGNVARYRIVTVQSSQSDTPRATTRKVTDVLVHESRLLIFRGVLTARYPALSGNFWDDSVLQRANEALKQSSSGWMSVSHLLTDASQGVLKISNLMQLLSTNGENALRKRMQMMDLARSVCRAILVDAEKESFERVATSFQGIPDVIDRQMMRTSSAADMPVTILFGRSPAGMNATGESDTRAWYDRVSAKRSEELTPKLEQLVRLVMAVDDGPTSGEVLDSFEIEYPPLWQETKKEKADAFKVRADALVALTTAQICLTEEAALSLVHSGEFDELDVAAREAALSVELKRLAEAPPPPVPKQLPSGGGPGGSDPFGPEAIEPA